MEKMLQKIDWDKFRIRSRRDWVIFWVFAALICYAAGSRYAYRADRWLFRFANPYMSDLNQPYTWGQLMVFLFLLAVVAEADENSSTYLRQKSGNNTMGEKLGKIPIPILFCGICPYDRDINRLIDLIRYCQYHLYGQKTYTCVNVAVGTHNTSHNSKHRYAETSRFKLGYPLF